MPNLVPTCVSAPRPNQKKKEDIRPTLPDGLLAQVSPHRLPRPTKKATHIRTFLVCAALLYLLFSAVDTIPLRIAPQCRLIKGRRTLSTDAQVS